MRNLSFVYFCRLSNLVTFIRTAWKHFSQVVATLGENIVNQHESLCVYLASGSVACRYRSSTRTYRWKPFPIARKKVHPPFHLLFSIMSLLTRFVTFIYVFLSWRDRSTNATMRPAITFQIVYVCMLESGTCNN